MKKCKPLPIRQIASSLLMVFTLLWLTISTPFIYRQQQVQQKIEKQKSDKDTDSSSNSLPNSTEEKSEKNTSTISEYLHDHQLIPEYNEALTQHCKCSDSDIYLAYHPELLSPPPEA